MPSSGASWEGSRTTLGVRPSLSGSAQENAALSLVLSTKAFGGVSEWKIETAEWNRTAMLLRDRTAIEIQNLERNVLGRLGDEQAEDLAGELYGNWVWLNKKAQDALANPPGWGEQVLAKLERFVGDFKAGALEAWQGYSAAAVTAADPVLRTFWETDARVKKLRPQLEDRKKAGEDVAADLAKIDEAQRYLDLARRAYSLMALGASLDQVARQKFGDPALGAANPTLIWMGVGIAAVGGFVYLAKSELADLKALGREFIEKAKNAFGDTPEERDRNMKMVGLLIVAGAAIYLLKD